MSSDEDDFMSDKYLLLAEQHTDAKLRRDKVEAQKFDTKIKNSDKLANINKPMVKQSKIEQVMFERIEEAMNTKIGSDNKGY